MAKDGGARETSMAAADLTDPSDAALFRLLERLGTAGYRFTTPAPSTYRRILLRRLGRKAVSLDDLFGWGMPFDQRDLDPAIIEPLRTAKALRRRGGRWSSTVGVASVGDRLFLHSAFRSGKDHVFFGPDSYRFVDFLRAEPAPGPGATVLDLGAGSGVGGIVAARAGASLVLADVNAQALRFARLNAAFAGLTPTLRHTGEVPAADGPFDLIVANPPYIAGSGLTYSDGGGALGAEISLEWARTALPRLKPGGRLLLYTGAAITRGRDPMREGLEGMAKTADCDLRYRELDPDVFPGTLLRPRYWGVERIAAVGAVVTKRSA